MLNPSQGNKKKSTVKSEVAGILLGTGLAMWLVYGMAAIGAMTGEVSMDVPSVWVGFSCSVIFLVLGFCLL